jgi:hypothetical protein
LLPIFRIWEAKYRGNPVLILGGAAWSVKPGCVPGSDRIALKIKDF